MPTDEDWAAEARRIERGRAANAAGITAGITASPMRPARASTNPNVLAKRARAGGALLARSTPGSIPIPTNPQVGRLPRAPIEQARIDVDLSLATLERSRVVVGSLPAAVRALIVTSAKLSTLLRDAAD